MGLMADAEKRTVTELRYYLAQSIIEAAKDAKLEECVQEDTGNPEFELSHDFVAGLLYAATYMVGNEQFDY